MKVFLQFVNPGLLNGLENPFATTLRHILKTWQCQDPFLQVSESYRYRIDVGMMIDQGDGNLNRIGPLHSQPSRA